MAKKKSARQKRSRRRSRVVVLTPLSAQTLITAIDSVTKLIAAIPDGSAAEHEQDLETTGALFLELLIARQNLGALYNDGETDSLSPDQRALLQALFDRAALNDRTAETIQDFDDSTGQSTSSSAGSSQPGGCPPGSVLISTITGPRCV